MLLKPGKEGRKDTSRVRDSENMKQMSWRGHRNVGIGVLERVNRKTRVSGQSRV